ncbi:MAG: hypothetical protein RJA57_1370 [Bacteroidota bacterium]
MSEREWKQRFTQDAGRRRSELCKAQDVHADWYLRWCGELREAPRFHRKQWEFVYNMQALWERGCIAPGKKGLVFAVGTEPAPSLFAAYGCEILATDLFPERGIEAGWTQADQLCFGLESLNTRGLVPDAILQERVRYRAVDMTAIPDDLRDFDFNWSSCALEHLGTLEKGLQFLKDQLRTLKPGGWAVHTTEFNLSSNNLTQNDNPTVLFRHRDIDRLVAELRADGHFVEELDFSIGGWPEDFQVDVAPHRQEVHLKLQVGCFVVTSIGIIIRKGPVLHPGG